MSFNNTLMAKTGNKDHVQKEAFRELVKTFIEFLIFLLEMKTLFLTSLFFKNSFSLNNNNDRPCASVLNMDCILIS